MAITPAKRIRKVKKRNKQFIRHQQDRFIRIRHKTWRRPKGIDSRVRRGFRGNIIMPSIGYGTKAAHRHVMPDGFLKFRVSNVAELELLLMHNRSYAAEIAGNVSAPNRLKIVARAEQLNIKVTNKFARIRTAEGDDSDDDMPDLA
jgi:large subunit ribosomal protein L32e